MNRAPTLRLPLLSFVIAVSFVVISDHTHAWRYLTVVASAAPRAP